MRYLATLGFIGYLPAAPGTFGSFAAMVFFLLLKPSLPLHITILIVVVAVGTVASHRAEKILNEKDSRHIVIDECAGYAVSLLCLPPTVAYALSAFLLFRFFDILKPPPIRWIERTIPGGAGVMADDVLAGIYTNIFLQVWILLAQH